MLFTGYPLVQKDGRGQSDFKLIGYIAFPNHVLILLCEWRVSRQIYNMHTVPFHFI